MLPQTRYLIFAAINLALLTSGCAAGLSDPVAPASAPVQCSGGTLQSEADAAAYSSCDSVNGDLRIRKSSLTSLQALSRLRSVSGTLEISDNPELEDLRGLENLRQAGSIVIEHNGIYDSVGLGRLREVSTLVVKNNPKLISLRGFKALERAQSVEIRNNPRLAAYYGLLPQLVQVEAPVILRHNAGLSKRDVREVLERVERVERVEQPPVVVAREAQREALAR